MSPESNPFAVRSDADTLLAFHTELAPEGILEETFALEIVGAARRLQRCRTLEEAFANPAPDDEKTALQQRTTDRARSLSHLILRRSIAELRILQTERQIRIQLFPNGVPGPGLGVMEFRKAVQQTTAPAAASSLKTEDIKAMAQADFEALVAPADSQLARKYRESGLKSFCKPGEVAPPPESSICKSAPNTPAVSSKVPRNAPCPCRSGAKYKKCCGGPAAPAAPIAA